MNPGDIGWLLVLASFFAAEIWFLRNREQRADDVPPQPYERLADWERRLGEHRAAERLKAAGIKQAEDRAEARRAAARRALFDRELRRAQRRQEPTP